MTTQPPDVQRTPDARTASLAALEAIQEACENQVNILAAIGENLETLLKLTNQFTDALAAMKAQPAAAATGDQPAANVIEFTADALVMTYNDKGEPAYKLTGHPYSKYGVRIWPEIIPSLDIDLEACKPGPNPLNPPRRVVALLGEHGPKKIIGPAITFTPQPHPSSPEAPDEDEPPF